MLIPVGAALVARDSVVEATKPYTSRDTAERELTKLQRQVRTDLKKFERRGNTARNRVQREVKRARTRAERELRQRRTQATRLVKRNRREAERQVKSVRRDVERQVKTTRRTSRRRSARCRTRSPRLCRRHPLTPVPLERRARGETAGPDSSAVMQYLSSLNPRRLRAPGVSFWAFRLIPMPTEEQIRDALRSVIDPELRKDIVELGMVRAIEQGEERARARARVAHHARLPDPLAFPGRRRRSTSARSRA